MAQNPDFKKIVFEDVEFAWPRLDQPYRFDQHKKESVPCAAGAQNANYSVAWTIDSEKASKFRQAMEDHYAACKARKPALPDFSGVFGMKEAVDDGVTTFTITGRKSAMNNEGEENKPPAVIDIYHDELLDKKIWGGSVGSVRLFAYPSTNPQNGLGGISLSLGTVLVKEAKYGGANYEEDFGAPAKKEFPDQPNGQQNSEDPGAGMDDEIPF